MKRLLLISLVCFLCVFIVLGATLVYVRYGGEDRLPTAIEVLE